MRYHVLATDYDGTIATQGTVDEETLAALERVRASGRKLVLVSGRELEDLQLVFDRLDLFDSLVLENGAIIYRPATREVRLLAEPPPAAFVEALRTRGVGPISVGRVIVATWEPHEAAVLDTIREMGLELQVIFNKGAVMILPSGINKAIGLNAALDELGFSRHNAVGVGDAENDHAFLAACECAVAVSNALPTLKERADVVTAGDHGRGVRELCDALVGDDLAGYAPRLVRHALPIATADDGSAVSIPAYGPSVLVVGTSGAGKSTLAQAFLEQLGTQGYQFCILDPEGDYAQLTGATALGDATHPPSVDEVCELLDKPGENICVNLLGVSLADRPAFFDAFFPRLQALRARTGRPHWIVLDEVHHLLPTTFRPSNLTLPRELNGLLLITIHPEHVAPAILEGVDMTFTIGAAPADSLRDFARAIGVDPPMMDEAALPRGEALVWSRRLGGAPVRVKVNEPRTERRRHVRKYAVGELAPDESFYFRGPEGKLRLRAQNLQLFLQVADGIDDATWAHHLRRGDYSQWFRSAIKDPDLAAAAASVETAGDLPIAESKARIRAAIEARYTGPA